MSGSPEGTPPAEAGRTARVPVAVERSYALALWVLERVRRYPKPWQPTLGTATAECALAITLSLVDATYRREKGEALRRANDAAQRLRLLLRMATDLRVLSPRQLEFAAERVDEVGRMIGGWLRQQGGGRAGRDVRADRELRQPAARRAGVGEGEAGP